MSDPLIPQDLDAYIQQKVALGEFSTRDEFLAVAAGVYRQMEQCHDQLKHDIALALDQSAEGLAEPFDAESIKRDLRERIEGRGRAS